MVQPGPPRRDRSVSLFNVPDMTSYGCVRAIEAHVIRIDPQAVVTAHLEVFELHIRTQAPAEDLLTAMQELGFTPTLCR